MELRLRLPGCLRIDLGAELLEWLGRWGWAEDAAAAASVDPPADNNVERSGLPLDISTSRSTVREALTGLDIAQQLIRADGNDMTGVEWSECDRS